MDASRRLDEKSQAKIDLSRFDESDPRQHQMKILFGCGVYFGFRGQNEHVFLETSNITHGSFSSDHPFNGHDWFGVENIQDKTHKLSIYKDRVRDTKNCMRMPVMDNDPTSADFGGSIRRYLTKLAPGQTRLYCKVVPEEFRAVDNKGNYQVFYGNQPLGKNAVSELFKQGAALLGMPSPQKFTPHSLRAYMVTMLANGEGKYPVFFVCFFNSNSQRIYSCIF